MNENECNCIACSLSEECKRCLGLKDLLIEVKLLEEHMTSGIIYLVKTLIKEHLEVCRLIKNK